MSEGVRRIAAERQRQVSEEGWTAEHDDTHGGGQLARAAACYAAPAPIFTVEVLNDEVRWRSPWPYGFGYRGETVPWHRGEGDRVRDLEKAGALIAAEIDRLLRRADTG